MTIGPHANAHRAGGWAVMVACALALTALAIITT